MTVHTAAAYRGHRAVSLKRNFRVNFTRLRKQRGLTQKDVAKGIRVSQKTVSRWMDEDGPNPNFRQCEKIVKLFKCSYAALLDNPPDVEDDRPEGPVTIVLTGDPSELARALRDIQSKWSGNG